MKAVLHCDGVSDMICYRHVSRAEKFVAKPSAGWLHFANVC